MDFLNHFFISGLALGALLGGVLMTLVMLLIHRRTSQQSAQWQHQLQLEFQQLAQQVLEEKNRTLQQHSEHSLQGLLQPFHQQIQAFQQRVNQIHDASTRGQTELRIELQRVLEIGLAMSDEAYNLTQALKGEKKITGNWGELQLQRTLELAGLEADVHFKAQPSFKDEAGRRALPDFVLYLPDQKHIVIDSKTSLVDFDRALSTDDPTQQQLHLDAMVRAIRQHIVDLSGKNYSALAGMSSPDFVFMFIPIENAYIQAMQHDPSLFDYAAQRNIMLVSHTGLLPILRTVANVWVLARGQEQAVELANRAGDIYNQVVLVAERLKKLGENLQQTTNQYNQTVTAVAGQQGLLGKVQRYKELSPKATKTMPEVSELHQDIDHHRL